MSSRITVTRDSPDDVQQRQIVVWVDGERVGELLFGKQLTQEIAPGRHTIQVDNTWNRKAMEFEIGTGEEILFRTASKAGKFTWFLLAAIGAGPMYVSLEKVVPDASVASRETESSVEPK